MRSDDDVRLASLKLAKGLLLLLLITEAGEHIYRDGESSEAAFKCSEMLKRKDCGGHENRNLLSVLYRLERGTDGNLGLAVAHVTAHDSVHGIGRFHILGYFIYGRHLAVGLLVFKGVGKLTAHIVVRLKHGQMLQPHAGRGNDPRQDIVVSARKFDQLVSNAHDQRQQKQLDRHAQDGGNRPAADLGGDQHRNKNTDDDDNNEEGRAAAAKAAEQIGIPFIYKNVNELFENTVIDNFCSEYMAGRTPNPCVYCNPNVKFKVLIDEADRIGAFYIATGHYARVVTLSNGRYALQKSATSAKDQTYALYNLTQYQLSHTLMPVGEYTKEEIRKIAEKINIRTANKPDSQEICFIPDKDYAGFIEREVAERVPPEGNFVTADGKVIGRHKGITHYTIGQRKGLNLAMGHPVFVTEIRPDTNEVVIGENEDVFGTVLKANHLNFMAIEEIQGEMEVTAKIRYSHAGAPCIVKRVEEDLVECHFKEPVRAITPGQAVVFYQGDIVVGGGTIL